MRKHKFYKNQKKEGKKMKRFSAILLVVCMILSLCACGSSQTSPSGSTNESTSETTPKAAATDNYPAEIINVVIPTDEGGAVDRAVQAFTSVWSKKLGATFQSSFYPGANGQVGYEYFVTTESDGYTLLCNNIGPDMLMYSTQNPGYDFPGDYTYFAAMDSDPCVIWVSKDSPFDTIEDLIEEAKTRTVTIATSRFPHPATLACLILAEQTGADFNIIPYGGGSATRNAGITGEVDAVTTQLSSSSDLLSEVKVLILFDDENNWAELSQDAPVPSDKGWNIPAMGVNRAWAVSNKFIEDYPERFELLVKSFEEAMNDPAVLEAFKAAGMDPSTIGYIDMEGAMKIAKETLAMANEYAEILAGG